MLSKPELLAPAGNWESLVAAVSNGADAVYLGGKSFNARHSAGNFDDREIGRAAEFAHVRGAKVYVTVNVLLDEQELPQAIRFLHFLQQCGADAAIVQDLGLIRLARKVIPELPLHASTQMTVHNLPTVRLLKESGIKRVVLARELSAGAVKNIVQQGGVEIEVFVHGALCICYSGQCLMSSMIGGRSGNRGRCAQPCRLQYVLVDRWGRELPKTRAAGQYILSPRDLNLSEHLPDLIDAGVRSIKIEGRMKRPEYVATVIRIYRALIDRAAAGGEFFVAPDEARELAQIFNRDFTTGYFYGRPGRELMSYNRPNNRGIRLGRVRKVVKKGRLAEILLEAPLRVGDGIEVWVSKGGRVAGEAGRIMLEGRSVHNAPPGANVQLDMPGQVFPGDRVFKTHDDDLIERARASFASPREHKKIPLIFTVCAVQGAPLKIKVEDPDGFTGEAGTDSPCQGAIDRPLNHAYLEKQLNRLGNTPFSLAGLECRLEGAVIAPVSEINEARRLALARLATQRAEAGRGEPVSEGIFESRLHAAFLHGNGSVTKTGAEKPVLSVVVTDLESLRAAVKAGAGEVCLGGERYRSKKPLVLNDILAGGELCAGAGARFVLSAPRIIQDAEMDQFYRLLEKVSARHLDGVMVSSAGLAAKVREISGGPVFADFPLNVFNSETAAFLLDAGFRRVALSPELTLEQIKRLAPVLPVPAGVIVHGALPLMVSEYCAVGSLLGGGGVKGCPGPCSGLNCGLKDRKGVVFPVEMDQHCRMHLFNSRDLCVIDDIGALVQAGVGVLRIEAGRERAGYVRDVVKSYRAVMEAAPGAAEKIAPALKEALTKYSPQGFTKGHYYRGVL